MAAFQDKSTQGPLPSAPDENWRDRIRREGTVCKCRRCDYVWKSRVSHPKVCPRCHTFNWRKSQQP